QVFDPEPGQVCDGLFVIGWSRQASDGVVGKAKQDGERGMAVVNRYLQRREPGSAAGWEERLAALTRLLIQRRVPIVHYHYVQKLEAVEREESGRRGIEFFKHITDEDMLAVIETA